jgi:CRISPR-associated protein Csm5
MNFKLETITPVHVGSGEILSQFCDYIYDNGYVYYLEHEAIMEGLAKKPNCDNLIDGFIEVVKKQASGNNPDRINLKDFMERLGLDYKEYCLKRVRAVDKITEQVQLNIKTANRTYIPGSTLKGAIRTALISYHYQDKGRVKNKGGYIGEDIFGSFGDDILKFLSVSDSDTFTEDDLKISKFYKLNLKSKKTDISIIKEVIDKGVATTFTINCKAKKKQVANQFSYLYEGQEEKLLPIINEYSQKNIEKELIELRKGSGNEVEEIKDFYQSLLIAIKNNNLTKEAYLRIGAGKSFYDNTIAQKLSKEDLNLIIKKNFEKANPNFFPKTRTVIMEGLNIEVPGWIKISLS